MPGAAAAILCHEGSCLRMRLTNREEQNKNRERNWVSDTTAKILADCRGVLPQKFLLYEIIQFPCCLGYFSLLLSAKALLTEFCILLPGIGQLDKVLLIDLQIELL